MMKWTSVAMRQIQRYGLEAFKTNINSAKKQKEYREEPPVLLYTSLKHCIQNFFFFDFPKSLFYVTPFFPLIPELLRTFLLFCHCFSCFPLSTSNGEAVLTLGHV